MVSKMLNVPKATFAPSFQAERLVTASQINARGIDDTANLRRSPSGRHIREPACHGVEIEKATGGKAGAVLETDTVVERERVANGCVAGGIAIDFGGGIGSRADGPPDLAIGGFDIA